MRFDRIPSHEFKRRTEGCSFTQQEEDILKMLRKNESVVAIALQTHISTATVNRRIRSIKDKMANELY